jgi:hypothetical protein
MTRRSVRHSSRMKRTIELMLPPEFMTHRQLLAALRPSVARTAAEYRKLPLPLPLPPKAKRRMSVFDVFCATSSSRKTYFLSIPHEWAAGASGRDLFLADRFADATGVCARRLARARVHHAVRCFKMLR